MDGSRPSYSEAKILFRYNFVQNYRIRDALVWLDSAHRERTLNQKGRPGFDNFEQSYTLTVSRGCTHCGHSLI